MFFKLSILCGRIGVFEIVLLAQRTIKLEQVSNLQEQTKPLFKTTLKCLIKNFPFIISGSFERKLT